MIHHSIHISQPKQNQESEAVQQKRKFLAFPSHRIQEFNKQLQTKPKLNQESTAVQQKRKFLAFPSLRIQEFNKQLQKPHTRSSTYSAV
jgi:abortive infection bacteriophage resistance protein